MQTAERVEGSRLLGIRQAWRSWSRSSAGSCSAISECGRSRSSTSRHLGLSDGHGALLVGSYSARVLAPSVAVGVVADRWIGQKEPTIAGACIIIAGNLSLAPERLSSVRTLLGHGRTRNFLCVALGMIATGTRLLKPMVLNLVGGLYKPDDPGRESGYYFYYPGGERRQFLRSGRLRVPRQCLGLGLGIRRGRQRASSN